MKLIEALAPAARKDAGCKILAAGVSDALQLEQALEHIYIQVKAWSEG